MELSGRLVLGGFVEGVDLGLGGHLLSERQIVGGGQLSLLELA